MNNPDALLVLIPVVAIICVFSFTSVTAWATARRKEREAYYKSETLKKLAESPGPAAAGVLELMREEERVARRREREGQRIGGLVVTGVGISLMCFFGAIAPRQPGLIFIGMIPLLVGVALLLYTYALAPKD
jgi:hypothetical protein